MANIYEMAVKYYPNYWDKDRLITLVKAGKLTEEEYEKITKEPYKEMNK